MRARRVFLLLSAALLLTCGGVILWAWNSDLGRFRPHIEHYLGQELGRELAIGELHLRLGTTVRLSLRDLRIANPAWADSPDLLRISSLEASLPFAALFSRPVVIDRVETKGVSISAERSDEHGASWRLGDGVEARATTPGGTRPAALVSELDLKSLGLRLERPGGADPLVLEIDELTQTRRADDMLELSAGGRLNGQPVAYRGEVGTLTALLSGANVAFRGEGRIGPLSIAGSGMVDDVEKPHRPVFELELSGDDIAAVADMLGLTPPPPGPFRITARAEPGSDRLRLQLEAKAGESRLHLEGYSAGLLDLSRVDYALDAAGSNLGAFTRLLGAGEWPEEPFQASGRVERDHRLLTLTGIQVRVGEAAFDLDGELSNFPDLNNARLEFDLRGDDAVKFRELIGVRGVAVGPFSASGSLQSRADGPNEISVQARTAVGEASLSGTLGPGPGYQGLQARFRVDGHNAQQVFQGYGIGGFPAEPFTLDSSFEVRSNALEFERGVLATIGEDRLEVEGLLSFEPSLLGTDLRMKARGDDLSQFAPLSGMDLPIAAKPYELEAGLRITEKGYEVSGLTGRIGPNDVRADGLVTGREGFEGTSIAISVEGPDLETLLRDTTGYDVPAHEFSFSAHLGLARESLSLDDLVLTLGALEARGTMALAAPYDGSAFRLDARVTGPDVTVVVPTIEGLTMMPNAFDLDARITASNGRWTFEESELRLGDATLRANGQAQLFPQASDTNLQLSIDVPGLARLGNYRGYPLGDVALKLDATLIGEPGEVRGSPVTLQLGDSDLSGTLTWSTDDSVPRLDVVSHSKLIDGRQLRALFFQAEAEQDAPRGGEDGRIIPDYEFPMAALRRINASLEARADQYRSRLTNPKNVVLQASVEEGALRLDQLHTEGIRGLLNASGSLVPDGPNSAVLAVEIDLDDMVLDLRRDKNVAAEDLPMIELDASLAGSGADLRSVASSLNGQLYATSGPGIIPDSVLAFLDTGLLEQVFSALLPKTEERTTSRLQCFATRLEIADGQVETTPSAALVTDKVQMISRGSIDLTTERLDLSFEAHPTKAYQANVAEVLVNPFVKISGTLAEPALSFDAPRALIFGGAAAATGGLSIVAKGLWDRITGGADPCAKMLEAVQEAAAKAAREQE